MPFHNKTSLVSCLCYKDFAKIIKNPELVTQNRILFAQLCPIAFFRPFGLPPLFLLTDRVHPDARLHERDGADARDLHVLVGVVLVLAHELHVACAV